MGIAGRNHELQEVLMGSDDAEVNLSSRLGERALTQKGGELLIVPCVGQEVVDVCNLAEMRADRIQEDQLQVDVSLDEIDPRLVMVTVQQIEIFHARKIMETILNNISVDHFFIGLMNLVDLLFHFILEDIIEMGDMLEFRRTNSIALLFVEGLNQEHLKSRKLHDA